MIIHPNDNVEIREDGHKYALRDLKSGENVIKYGMPIGHAICDIAKGEHVHTHNVATNLGDLLEYTYEPEFTPVEKVDEDLYQRLFLQRFHDPRGSRQAPGA